MTPPRALEIIDTVAAHFGLTRDDLLGARRHKTTALARNIAMRICRDQPERWSFPEIGRFFGGRDHTTVMQACRRIARRVVLEGVAFQDYWLCLARVSGGPRLRVVDAPAAVRFRVSA